MVLGLRLFVGLFNNLALLIVFVAVYGFLIGRLRNAPPARRQAVLGIMFALFVFGCMQVKIPVSEGVVVDQRNAIVILAGAFGGPISGAIAALVAASYRVYLGGRGIFGGVLGIALSTAAGIFIRTKRDWIDTVPKAALVAVAATVFILPGFLPIGSLEEGWELLKAMALPYGSAISLGLLVGGLLLLNEERGQNAQTRLRESEIKYRSLFESLVDVIYKIDENGTILIISPSSEQVFGYRPDELVGRRFEILHRDPTHRALILERIEKEGSVKDVHTEMVRKDGRIIVVSSNAKAVFDSDRRFRGVEGVTRDITQLKEAEERLRISLAEKEILLSEIYHRTNNNMQIIASLLLLQATSFQDEKVDQLVSRVSSRIRAMSLVYDKLSHAKDLSRIGIREYLDDLTRQIAKTENGQEGRIAVELDVEDIALIIDAAVPLGLVVNEIVTNSFKHAFPDGRRGTVRVTLRRTNPDTVLLSISDDGRGFPPGFDPDGTSSFGIFTTLTLVRMQLRGTAKIESTGGVSYRITLKDRIYEPRI